MSRRPVVALALVSLLLAPVAAAPTAAGPDAPPAGGPNHFDSGDSSTAADDVAIAGAYPNPVTDGDRGEFVVVNVTASTHLGNWTVSDGETTANLPNRSVDGRVLLADDVDAATGTYANATVASDRITQSTLTTVQVPDLELSNAGETLTVANATGGTVATLTYEDAPEGEYAHENGFRALGETAHAAWTTTDVDARAFVLPDTNAPLDPIRRADDRVLLAGYTFASRRTAKALERAAARGVRVRVLVDDAPVGGVTRRQVRVLNRLADAGVTVRALGGDRARYDYQHAKYVVADDTAIVLTENWKPSGTGGHANRGWGVVLDDTTVADDLARVFASDWHAPDARPWTSAVDDLQPEPAAPANATYPTAVAPANVTADAVTLVTAPDNAERVLTNALRSATDRVRVLQMTAERDGVLLDATIAAARRGVDVRILLSSSWYAREENARVVDALNALADRENLPLEARLVDPAGRFQKVHAKGVVVDDQVVVGSINWNDHSLRKNREVAVVLHGDAVANYYADAFESDWAASGSASGRVPWWLAAAAALAVLALLAVLARRVELTDDAHD